MTKRSNRSLSSEALIDGLELLTLQDDLLEPLSESEQAELSRSMQLILAASAARAKEETVEPRPQRKKTGLRKSAAIKVAELRALLASVGSVRPDLSASLEADQDSDEKALDSLINDIERIMSSKRKV
jgi:hypothetical protein